MAGSIGSLTGSLTLESATFIRDIGKTTKAMEKSLGSLHSSFVRVQKLAAGVIAGDFGLRAISNIERLTAESLKLAESLGGDVGEQAKAAERSLANFGDAFQFGVAQGFLESFSAALGTNQDTLNTLTLSGKKLGQVVGTALTGMISLLERAEQKSTELGKAWERLATIALDPNLSNVFHAIGGGAGLNALPMPGGEGGTSSFAKGIQDAEGNIIAFNAAQAELLQQMKDEPGFWDATTTATRNWTEALRDANTIIAETQTPYEAYRQKLEEVQLLQSAGIITSQQAATASMQAGASIANTWVATGSAVTGALANLFEGNKAFAIANAVMNTAEAITAALKNPPGPPFSFVYAAAAAASGAAQIATILSARPGSGAKSASIKGGKTKAASSAAPSQAAAAPATAGGGFTQAVTISIVGDVFGPEHFRKIVAGLNNVQRDGTALLRIA